jgi:hypothetical protein
MRHMPSTYSLAKPQSRLASRFHAVGDFAGDELATSQRAFVVEENAAATEYVVALAVVHRHPVRVELGHTVGTAGVERGVLLLGDGLHLAKHLGRAGLVEPDLGVYQTDRLQQVKRTDTGDLCRGVGLVKRHANKTLGSQVVNLYGVHLLHQGNAGSQVGQVVLHQMKVGVVLDAQLVNAPEIDGASAAIGAVHGVALFKQQLRQVGAVLTGDSGDDGGLHSWLLIIFDF